MTDQPFSLNTGLPSPAPEPDAVRAAVASITARDPAFNLDSFLAEAHQAFWLVGQSHAQCKPELCQSVLSPGLAEREMAEIRQECANGTVRAPLDDDASSGQLVSIESDANRDTATVHFISTWRPTAQGSKQKEEHRVQNWCFQRLATAQTVLAGEGERCENCGAVLTSTAARCRFCGTPVSPDAGWRVIRVDEVGRQQAAEAIAAMREIMGTFAAAREAAKAAAPAPAPAPPRRRASVSGCLTMIFYAAIAAVAVVVTAMGNSGSFHRAVAKVIPAIRYPILKGPTDLSGRVVAQQVTLTQTVPAFHTGGTCSKEAVRTSWEFKGKLPDGSSFRVEFGLPPAAGGPGTYHRPQLTLSASASNKSSSVSWSAPATANATLVVKPDGGGDLHFVNLPGDQASGGGPLSGHLVWSCSVS